MLYVGALTALGVTGWDRSGLLAQVPGAARAKSCILLWLDGGPSHLETWDVKPEAPVEVRGPFGAIASATPGIRLSELLPQTAQVTEHLAIVRSVTSPLGEHGLANHYMLTGYPPSPALVYPSLGSVVAHLHRGSSDLPKYVAIPEARSAGAGYLGTACEPFVTAGDPSKPGFQVRDLELFAGVDQRRLERRREFLLELDRMQHRLEQQHGTSETTGFDGAFRLLQSTAAKQAFDLESEPQKVRARYGSRMFGQSCLLARRLVERGVPFVTVFQTGWDTHNDLKLQLRDGYSGAKEGVGLVPTFDQAYSALISDLADRGLLSETLVVVMGEFGRTPKLNNRGGRDHWPRVFSVALAGGGIRGGQVYGASDRVGESPLDLPVTPADLACSIYTLLGIDPQQRLHTDDGRPVAVQQNGRFIEELV